jgi:hypothetical protein
MVFTSEHKRFIIVSYFRNSAYNNGEWLYCDVACLTELTKNTSLYSGYLWTYVQNLKTSSKSHGIITGVGFSHEM